MKNLIWRLVLVLAVVIAAIVYLLPTFNPEIWPHKKIHLGLDLQGGMHLLLEVDTIKAVESTVERFTHELRNLCKKERIDYTSIDRVEGTKITAKIKEGDKPGQFEKLLDKEFKNLRIRSKSTESGMMNIVLDLPDKESDHIQKMAADQALETIRNRIDQFGVSEPDIRRQGEKQIVLQLAGITDTKRAKELIGKTALLEFKLVDETGDPYAAEKGTVPPGTELLYEVKEDKTTNRSVKTPFLIKKQSLLTGASLQEARVLIDSQYGEPYVSIKFDTKGAKIFERITEENVKKRLAIVLDKVIYSAPVIQEKIAGGEARITGRFTEEDARDLAIVLRAGALPAPVNILEERTVGPSLGSDSVKQGLIAGLVGCILVALFMAVYYKMSGLIADLALLLNIILIAGGLAAFQATLTLPGIAGIVLTIGMTVDANVLIYERIREELRLGKPIYAAIAAGYDRATTTILDANLTTLIAALVLFQFGTGAVKGFAVTLSMGVTSSMFTAIVVTRIIFDYLVLHRKMAKLSI